MNGLFDLTGQTALVIGGAGALGRQQALALAAAGASVALGDADAAGVNVSAEQLAAAGTPPVATHAVDITDPASVNTLVQAVVDQASRIDILVNSAGMTQRSPSEEFAEPLFDRILDVNLDGVCHTCLAVGRVMLAQGGGRVINMGSIFSTVGLPESPAYCASKGAVAQLTRTLAVEWAPHGVAVNALLPSWFATPMGNVVAERERFYEGASRLPDTHDLESRTVGRVPLGRLGEPWEIGGATVFLASRGATMVTGHLLAVDGGFLAQ